MMGIAAGRRICMQVIRNRAVYLQNSVSVVVLDVMNLPENQDRLLN